MNAYINQPKQSFFAQNKTAVIWGGIAFVVLVLLMMACSSYNSLVGLDEDVNAGWANVQSQYQRRIDLIPNLVATVKGSAEFEKSTLENVTNARAGVLSGDELLNACNEADGIKIDPNSSQTEVAKYMAAQDKLKSAFNVYVNAVHEAYPQLASVGNFKDLQAQIEGTENRINTARIDYNNLVKEYNVKVRRFPSNIWASMCGFEKRPMFEASQEAQSVPNVGDLMKNQ